MSRAGEKPIVELADQLSIAGTGTATLGPTDVGGAAGVSLWGLSTGEDCSIVIKLYPHGVNSTNHGNIVISETAVVLADGVAQVIQTDNMKIPHGSIAVTYTNGASATVLDLVAVLHV